MQNYNFCIEKTTRILVLNSSEKCQGCGAQCSVFSLSLSLSLYQEK